MALGSCYTCIKYLMFAFNFIFWLLGCAILGVGIWLRVDEKSAEFIHASSQVDILYNLSYALIAIGFLIMLVGFMGCCGAIRESQCMLSFFFIFLFIIFATLLGFGIWAAVAKESFKDLTSTMLTDSVDTYDTNPASKSFMDLIQTSFNCCGNENAISEYGGDIDERCPSANILEKLQGCHEPFYDWIQGKLIVVAGIAIGIAVVMILGMIFSMVLCCAIRDAVA